jgi:hypothetical protein
MRFIVVQLTPVYSGRHHENHLMTPDQQLHNLQRYGNDALLMLLRSLLILAALLLFAAAYYYRELMYLMIGIFVTLVTIALLKSTPHIRHAVRASRQGIPFAGTLEIAIDDTDDMPSYTATTRDRYGHYWKFEFLPQGWKPAAGQTPAELFSIADIAWPVLIRTEHGILYPRYTPKRLEPPSPGLPAQPSTKERP